MKKGQNDFPLDLCLLFLNGVFNNGGIRFCVHSSSCRTFRSTRERSGKKRAVRVHVCVFILYHIPARAEHSFSTRPCFGLKIARQTRFSVRTCTRIRIVFYTVYAVNGTVTSCRRYSNYRIFLGSRVRVCARTTIFSGDLVGNDRTKYAYGCWM